MLRMRELIEVAVLVDVPLFCFAREKGIGQLCGVNIVDCGHKEIFAEP
jgi:hypothetical protein